MRPLDNQKTGEKLAWKAKAADMGRWYRALPWAIGDHINSGLALDEHWAYQNMTAFGLATNNISDWSYCARVYPEADRMLDLTIIHHREVAALKRELRQQLLEEALVKGWSTKELRRQKRYYVEQHRVATGYYKKLARKVLAERNEK